MFPIKTIHGEFLAHYSDCGLMRLEFPDPKHPRPQPSENGAKISPQIRAWHALTARALRESLSGRAPRELPPLDLAVGTEFQKSVWHAMLRIPYGRTLSYAEIAADISRPKALRAVGNACGANPIPVLVPCHRVLAAHQRLGGFSSGLDWKRKLLAIEGNSAFVLEVTS